MEKYYIGGSPCSGKSTIAEMIVKEYGFEYYKIDDFLQKHMERGAKEGKPYCISAMKMDFNQMWMRDPQIQAIEEIAIYEEIFPYALEDLQNMGDKKPIIAEGAGFMPKLMAEQNILNSKYVCIVPTDTFQRENYSKRPWIKEFLKGCEDPHAAFDNWMTRDSMFAGRMIEQAEKFGYSSMVVDGNRGIDENYNEVITIFGLCKP